MKKLYKIFGFTLPEVVMSICILSVIILTIMSMFVSGILGIKKGENLVLATNVVESTLEFYAQQILYAFSDPNFNPGTRSLSKVTFESISFERKLNISELPYDPNNTSNRLKIVTVSVYWYEKGIETKAKKREVQYKSYVSNYLDYPKP